MLTYNVGLLDRTIRIVAGLLVLGLVFTGPRTPWGWLGLIPLLTGLFGTCPLYSILHVSSLKGAGRASADR